MELREEDMVPIQDVKPDIPHIHKESEEQGV